MKTLHWMMKAHRSCPELVDKQNLEFFVVVVLLEGDPGMLPEEYSMYFILEIHTQIVLDEPQHCSCYRTPWCLPAIAKSI